MTFIQFLVHNRHEMAALTLQHLLLVVAGTGAATVFGIPVGIVLTRKPALSKPVLALANVLQTVPSLALFGFLVPLLARFNLGIGPVPAIIALFLYSLLPIIRNTFTGINGVEPGIRDAARGLGLTDWQILTMVELPLSTRVILAGVRVATVISVGTATIAAAIGAGGLGVFIFRGLRVNDNQLILAGAIPAALMALLVDFGLGWTEKRLGPARTGDQGRARRSRLPLELATAAAAIALFAALIFFGGRSHSQVVVGSKDFTEQVILGEILAQTIESKAHLSVERKFELGGDLCHRAITSGEIDTYVEYTGTAYATVLKRPPIGDAGLVYDQVKAGYASSFRIDWFPPLGFNNTFAILVRRQDADRLNLKTISDLIPHAPKMRAAFGQDFVSRADGYSGFVKAYGLHFDAPPGEMDLSLTYRALAAGQVDLIAGNSTDGMIEKLGLYQLQDDRHYFPPYQAAVLVRQETLKRYPHLTAIIGALAGRISDSDMRELNYEVDALHRSPADVAREFLSHQGLD